MCETTSGVENKNKSFLFCFVFVQIELTNPNQLQVTEENQSIFCLGGGFGSFIHTLLWLYEQVRGEVKGPTFVLIMDG